MVRSCRDSVQVDGTRRFAGWSLRSAGASAARLVPIIGAGPEASKLIFTMGKAQCGPMSRSTWDQAGNRRRSCCLHQNHCIPDAVQGSPELTKLMTRYWLLGHARFAEVLLFESAYRTVTKSVKLPRLWSLGVRHEY